MLFVRLGSLSGLAIFPLVPASVHSYFRVESAGNAGSKIYAVWLLYLIAIGLIMVDQIAQLSRRPC